MLALNFDLHDAPRSQYERFHEQMRELVPVEDAILFLQYSSYLIDTTLSPHLVDAFLRQGIHPDDRLQVVVVTPGSMAVSGLDARQKKWLAARGFSTASSPAAQVAAVTLRDRLAKERARKAALESAAKQFRSRPQPPPLPLKKPLVPLSLPPAQGLYALLSAQYVGPPVPQYGLGSLAAALGPTPPSDAYASLFAALDPPKTPYFDALKQLLPTELGGT